MNDQHVFIVTVNRTDTAEPMWVLETQQKAEAISCHQELTKEWAASAAEKRPFVLTSPKITSFLPALIYEIEVLEMTPQEYHASKTELTSIMKKQGLTGFMHNNGWKNS